MIIPLILTLLIEGVTLFLLKERFLPLYLYWAALTTLTNVLLNFTLRKLFLNTDIALFLAIAVLELLVFISELALCYLFTRDFKKSAKYSLFCNLASFLIGSFLLALV